jgi:hypothetical protein
MNKQMAWHSFAFLFRLQTKPTLLADGRNVKFLNSGIGLNHFETIQKMAQESHCGSWSLLHSLAHCIIRIHGKTMTIPSMSSGSIPRQPETERQPLTNCRESQTQKA